VSDYTSLIQNYLTKKGSPLSRYASDFVQVGNKYGIDPRFLVAVSGIETSFGKAGSGIANPFGYRSAKKYSGPREVLELMGRDLTRTSGGYYKGKDTISSIGATWAPPGASNDPNNTNGGWPSAVSQFYREMGGDPTASVKNFAANGGSTGYVNPIADIQGRFGAPYPTGQNFQNQFDPKLLAEIKSYAANVKKNFRSGDRRRGGVESLRASRKEFNQLLGKVMTQLSVNQSNPTDPTAALAAASQGNSQMLNSGSGLLSGQLSLNDVGQVPLPEGNVDSGKLFRGGVGGNWGGSMNYAMQLQQLAGITPSSQKRSRQRTASGGVSDHWQGSANSYAMDLPGTPGDGRTDQAAQRIVEALGGGKNWGGGNFVTTQNGYRFQVIWKSNVGGNHYDHIHVGVRKAGSGGGHYQGDGHNH
jgi:hypothetical protein